VTDDQRSAICDTAKYLRQIRPIDPGEIYEYVEGRPHPGDVRRVLREEAPVLGLIEREDGRFEPPPEGPVAVDFDGVDRLPESVSRALEELLVEAFGSGWPDGESGDHLRSRIREIKARYFHGERVTYDEVTALGYAIYHLPASFAAVQYVLADLAADDLLPHRMRVLDVGSGVGGQALGFDAVLPSETLVEYHAVEPSDAAGVLDRLLAETGRNFHPTSHRTTIETFEPDGTYDLLVCANVLSELDEPVSVLGELLDALADGGTVLALAPADRNTAIHLREIERELEGRTGVTVYAPAVRLWPGERPAGECWSFDREPDLEVPAFQRRLDEGERVADSRPSRNESTDETGSTPRRPGDGEFVNADVQYAYTLLRTDGKQAVEFEPDPTNAAKMAVMDAHVTDRIDCVAIKLSHDLSSGGNPLFLVGDGSEQVDHFAVLTEPSGLNRPLATADYGALLRFENVLVLWNDDEKAYNLVVDGETIVDRIPA